MFVQIAVGAVALTLAAGACTGGGGDTPATRTPAPSAAPHGSESAEPDAASAAIDRAVNAYFTGGRANSYGGRYLDEGGRTVVLVTANVDEVRAALLRRLPSFADRRLVVAAARFPLADLRRVADVLTARLPGVPDADIADVAVDEAANRVVVGLTRDDPAARAAVLRLFGPRDRAMLAFEEAGQPVLE